MPWGHLFVKFSMKICLELARLRVARQSNTLYSPACSIIGFSARTLCRRRSSFRFLSTVLRPAASQTLTIHSLRGFIQRFARFQLVKLRFTAAQFRCGFSFLLLELEIAFTADRRLFQAGWRIHGCWPAVDSRAECTVHGTHFAINVRVSKSRLFIEVRTSKQPTYWNDRTRYVVIFPAIYIFIMKDALLSAGSSWWFPPRWFTTVTTDFESKHRIIIFSWPIFYTRQSIFSNAERWRGPEVS